MKSRLSSPILLATILAIDVPARAQVARLELRSPDEPIHAFERTPDRDWRTTIKTADGLEREFIYVPPTKIAPELQVALSWIRADNHVQVQYDYRIANGPTARQQLARLSIGAVQSLTLSVKQLPAGWTLTNPQRPGNVSLYGPLKDGKSSGLRPGTVDVLILEGRMLPGVVVVRAISDASGAVEVPPGLTDTQYRELDLLSKVATVDAPAIGPAIPIGLGESELTFDIVLSRIVGHYSAQFALYRHPLGPDIARILVGVVRSGVSDDDAQVRQALVSVRDLSMKAVKDPWHRQLSDALGLCMDALLSGSIP